VRARKQCIKRLLSLEGRRIEDQDVIIRAAEWF
jgi:hypothetical protein